MERNKQAGRRRAATLHPPRNKLLLRVSSFLLQLLGNFCQIPDTDDHQALMGQKIKNLSPFSEAQMDLFSFNIQKIHNFDVFSFFSDEDETRASLSQTPSGRVLHYFLFVPSTHNAPCLPSPAADLGCVPSPSAPGSDQRCFSRSLVMRRAEPLGASQIPRPPLQENSTTSPIKAASSRYIRTWNSHLASTRLPSHAAPRVPEEGAARQRRIVS